MIYVDADGKSRIRSEAPMVTSDILSHAGIELTPTQTQASRGDSRVLRKLRAA